MSLALCFRIMSWWDYGYQIAGMANRTTLVDNNTWNNSHIALVWVNLRLLGYYIADTYSTFPYSREREEELATLSSIQDTSHTMSLMNIVWCISASDRDRVRKWCVSLRTEPHSCTSVCVKWLIEMRSYVTLPWRQNFWVTTNWKRHLKSEFSLLQTSYI